MQNKEALVFAETIGLAKNFDQHNSKSYLIQRQHFCSHCGRELADDSIIFKDICACPPCFRSSRKSVNAVRRYRREYRNRFPEVFKK